MRVNRATTSHVLAVTSAGASVGLSTERRKQQVNRHTIVGARPFGAAAAIAIAVGVSMSGAATSTHAATVVASWDFNQVGGVIKDQQLGESDLTLSGPWTSVAGNDNDGSAIRFEASPASATTTVAGGNRFNPGKASFALTIVFRASQDVTSGSPNVAQHGSFSETGQIKVQLAAGGKAGCRIKGERAAFLFYHPTANVNDNQWHTITCARNGDDLSVTVDGSTFSPAGKENPGSVAVSNEPFRFAQKLNGMAPDQFVGDIGFASYSQ